MLSCHTGGDKGDVGGMTKASGETCRQAISEGRHVNMQMRALKAAWEAHKREVHQQ